MIYHMAYLDPGTGSFLLQLIAGGAFGGMFVLKKFWRQTKQAVLRRSPAVDHDPR